MTNTTLLQRSSVILAAGGLSWLAKMAVLTATDGGDSALASVFYLLGVGLMSIGLAGVAVALTARRHVALRALAGAAGFVSFFVSYLVIEGIAKSAAGEAGPAWFGDEVGILATGAVMAAAGLFSIPRAGCTQPSGRVTG